MVQDHKFESIFYKFYFWAEGLFINDVITWQPTLGENFLFVQGNCFREKKNTLKMAFFCRQKSGFREELEAKPLTTDPFLGYF